MTEYVRPPKARNYIEYSSDPSSSQMREKQRLKRKSLSTSPSTECLQNKENSRVKGETISKNVLQPVSADDKRRIEAIKNLPEVIPASVRLEGNLIVATKLDGSPLNHVKAARAKAFSAELEDALKEPREPLGPPSAEALAIAWGDGDFFDRGPILW